MTLGLIVRFAIEVAPPGFISETLNSPDGVERRRVLQSFFLFGQAAGVLGPETLAEHGHLAVTHRHALALVLVDYNLEEDREIVSSCNTHIQTCFALSPRLFSKTTDMIGRVFKSISIVINVEIIISHHPYSETLCSLATTVFKGHRNY